MTGVLRSAFITKGSTLLQHHPPSLPASIL